jgi:hypothetical protein
MELPSLEEALECVHLFARDERVTVSHRAQDDMDNLGYVDADVCDCLCALELSDCEKVQWSHWPPQHPVLTCVATFEFDDYPPDRLFIEVKLPVGGGGNLYLLAFKLDGSPR